MKPLVMKKNLVNMQTNFRVVMLSSSLLQISMFHW